MWSVMPAKVYCFHLILLPFLGLQGLCQAGEEDAPSLDDLLELNAAELFGGEVKAKDGRVEIRFAGNGLFLEGFTVAGAAAGGSAARGFVADEKQIKDVATRKILLDGAEGKFTCLGRESGRALSKFELAGDLRIRFRLRIRSVPPTAQFVVTLNLTDSRNFIRTSFLTDVAIVDSGKVRREQTEKRAFLGPASRWFDTRSAGVGFEIEIKEKKLSTFLLEKSEDKEKRVELVSCEDLELPTGGKVGFEFRNMTFLMTDLVIEGKPESAWARETLVELKKAGKLKSKEPRAVAQKEENGEEAGTPASSESPQQPERRQNTVDISQPDPEAEVEL